MKLKILSVRQSGAYLQQVARLLCRALNAMKFEKVSHWGLQILPPLSLLFILSPHGPGMWFMLAFSSIFFLISVISLVAKLLNFNRNKNRMVRPALTVVVVASLYLVASLSYNTALDKASIVYSDLSESCTSEDTCNPDLSGWELRSDGRYMVHIGSVVTYPLFYRQLDDGFHLRLAKSLDMGDEFVKKW